MTDDTELRLWVPDDSPEDGDLYDGYYNCPVCDRPFVNTEWEKVYAFGDRSGFGGKWECPSDGCDGTVSVTG